MTGGFLCLTSAKYEDFCKYQSVKGQYIQTHREQVPAGASVNYFVSVCLKKIKGSHYTCRAYWPI